MSPQTPYVSPSPVSVASSSGAKLEYDTSIGNSVADVEEPGLWSRCSLVQVIYGLWAHQVILCTGLAFGFSGVIIPQLSVSTSVDAWTASVLMLTSLTGCIICGFTLDYFGRRNMMVICMAPMAVGWFLTGMAEDTRGMIYGRIVTGIGVGMAALPPRVYCTEIALPKMRGVLGAMPTLTMAVGIFLQGLLSVILSWNIVCHVCGAHAILILLLNIFLPETPYFILLSNKGMFEIRKSIKLFRSRDYDFEPELNRLVNFKMQNSIQKLSFPKKVKLSLSPETLKPFMILVIYCVLSELSGHAILNFWSVDVLNDTEQPHVYMVNVTFGITGILAAATLVIVIFYRNRRPMAITSAFAVAVLFSMLSMFLMTGTKQSYLPMLCFMMLIIAGTFGPYTLPMLMIFDVIPTEVRGFLGSIAVTIQYLVIFGVVKTFPYVRTWLDFSQTSFCFGMMSFICTIFVYFLLPETRGVSLLTIDESFIELRRKHYMEPRIPKKRHFVQLSSKLTILSKDELASNSLQQDTQSDQTNQVNQIA